MKNQEITIQHEENHTQEKFLECLNQLAEIMKADYNKFAGESETYKISFDFRGSKYVRVIAETYGSQSAAGFIVMSHNDKKFPYGTMLKAQTWKAPATNFGRGNIFNLDGKTVPWTGIS